MKPILLIHGYSSDGNKNTDQRIRQIYGGLPELLKDIYGEANVEAIDLSRWISLDDGVSLDDIARAMDRALKSDEYEHLLQSGFHVVIHSTGALVTRKWIHHYSPMPSPIDSVVHLAGANFGSGLAHIGRGTMARWKRQIFDGTDVGKKVLQSLEFGCQETIDLHLSLSQPGNDILKDFGVKEYCVVGSQVPKLMRKLPNRYVKEDNSDCTVRASTSNLNFNFVILEPTAKAESLTAAEVKKWNKRRNSNKTIDDDLYEITGESFPEDEDRNVVPFGIAYETAHIGKDLSIVDGRTTRDEMREFFEMIPLYPDAELTPDQYHEVVEQFAAKTARTYEQAAQLPKEKDWNKQEQYEAHAMVVFRIFDRDGKRIKDYDIYFKSTDRRSSKIKLESLIEDNHYNKSDYTRSYYLRVQQFDGENWNNLLDNIGDMELEITALEPDSDEISYVPLSKKLPATYAQKIIRPFQTTIVDVVLERLPSKNVFRIIQH